MAPNIVSGPRREAVVAPVEDKSPPPPPSEAVEIMRKLKSFIEQNSEYVGPRFAEEALKIHYEEAAPRSIYGEASKDELENLQDEGVEFHPLPVMPEDHN